MMIITQQCNKTFNNNIGHNEMVKVHGRIDRHLSCALKTNCLSEKANNSNKIKGKIKGAIV